MTMLEGPPNKDRENRNANGLGRGNTWAKDVQEARAALTRGYPIALHFERQTRKKEV